MCMIGGRHQEAAMPKNDDTTVHDDGSGPVVLAEIPAVLPREVLPLREWEDRARLAEHVSRSMFSVWPRTLETWPVRSILVNKRALLNTAEALDHARELLKEAEAQAVRAGRSDGAPRSVGVSENADGSENTVDTKGSTGRQRSHRAGELPEGIQRAKEKLVAAVARAGIAIPEI
jgi:hypothetical protein